MNRRSFLQKISAVLGLLALPVAALAGRKPKRIYRDDDKLDVISKQKFFHTRVFDGTDSYVKINQWVLHAEQADQMTLTKSLHKDDTMKVKVWVGLLPRCQSSSPRSTKAHGVHRFSHRSEGSGV